MLNMRRIFFLFFAATGMSVIGAAIAAEQPLFSPVPTSMLADAGNDRVMTALAMDRTIASIQLVEADSAQISTDRRILSINLLPGTTIVADRETAYVNPDGTIVWSGSLSARSRTLKRLIASGSAQVVEDPLNTIIVVRNGDKLTGTIRFKGVRYRISPLAGSGHAIVEIDESRMPPDHPPGPLPQAGLASSTDSNHAPFDAKALPGPFPPAPPGTVPRRTPTPVPPTIATTVIRAMVVVTDAAAAATGDPAGLVNLAIAETNQGYRNSRVYIRMELAGWYQTSYTTANFNTDLDRFTGTSDGFLDEFHATRNAIAADVNVLIINDPAYQYCGLGWLNSNAAYAFSVTEYRCATGNYTFAHEVGHNQGAHHDIANGNNSSFPYGHGYQMPSRNWRTVMAYACSGVSCPKVNYWSNPKRYYDGVPMGTGNTADNARVLNETSQRVAGFR